MFALRRPPNHGSTPRGTPRNFHPNRGGVRKKWLLAYKSSNISETRQDRTRVTIEVEYEVIYALSIGAKINDLGWPWRVIMHSVSKHVRLSELTVKIWMKIDVYCQRQRCSPMTLVSANIRFVPIFEGVHLREVVERQLGNRKHGFSRLSTVRIRRVKKWGQRYTIRYDTIR